MRVKKKIIEKIKSCPFCGSEGCTTYNTDFGFQVYCGNSDCFMNEVLMSGMETEEQAIQAWNGRTKELSVSRFALVVSVVAFVVAIINLVLVTLG